MNKLWVLLTLLLATFTAQAGLFDTPVRYDQSEYNGANTAERIMDRAIHDASMTREAILASTIRGGGHCEIVARPAAQRMVAEFDVLSIDQPVELLTVQAYGSTQNHMVVRIGQTCGDKLIFKMGPGSCSDIERGYGKIIKVETVPRM